MATLTDKKLETFILIALGILFFIYPIEKTTVIRNVLLITLLISTIYLNRNNIKKAINNKILKIAIIFIALFTIWIPIQAILFTDYTYYALNEFRSQWLLSLTAFIIGLCAFSTKKTTLLKPKNIFTVIFFAMFIHVLYTDLSALITFFKTGKIPTMLGGLTRARDENSFMINTFVIFVLIEIYVRIIHKKKLILINNLTFFNNFNDNFFNLCGRN